MQKEIVWVERGKGRDAKNVKNSEWVTDFDVQGGPPLSVKYKW